MLSLGGGGGKHQLDLSNKPIDEHKLEGYIMYILLQSACLDIKVRKWANIRNQAPHLTHETNGKVTTSQLDITNESQEVSPFPEGDHKASINRRGQKHDKYKKIYPITDYS